MTLLPVRYPPITSWPWISHALTIALRDTRYAAWFADHYLQLYCAEINGHYVVDFSHKYMLVDTGSEFPMLSTREVTRTDYSSYTDEIISRLSRRQYLLVAVDRNTMIGRERPIHQHLMLVYGYDESRDMFAVADHFEGGKYAYRWVPSVQLEQAMRRITVDLADESRIDEYPTMVTIRRLNVDYTLNLRRLQGSLEDYIESDNRILDMKFSPLSRNLHASGEPVGRVYGLEKNKRVWFGLNVYAALRIVLERFRSGTYGNGELRADRRPFHVLCDHKTSVMYTVEYLARTYGGQSKDLKRVYSCFEDLRRQATILRNTVIKWEFTGNENTLDSCGEVLHCLMRADASASLMLLDVVAKVRSKDDSADRLPLFSPAIFQRNH